jgi:hypothetical protein
LLILRRFRLMPPDGSPVFAPRIRFSALLSCQPASDASHAIDVTLPPGFAAFATRAATAIYARRDAQHAA